MMKKIKKTKAFTLIELMVSIFLTITVIASFYKLYEASLKTERTSSIRVSVNLLGEQILDAIASSMRLIGLNGEVGDLQTEDTAFGILRGTPVGGKGTESVSFSYVSPYGSPITKLQEAAGGTYPGCTFKLFNSAAFHSDISRLYIHNQQGVYVTKKVKPVSDASYSGNNVSVEVESFYTSTDNSKWGWIDNDKMPDGTSKTCAQRFPAGTLITGEDFLYTLTYQNQNELKLAYKALDANGSPTGAEKTVIDFVYDNSANQTFQIPFFVLEFLLDKTGDDEAGQWVTTFSAADRNDIVAVRFGFVILSLKDRVTVKDAASASLIDENLGDKKLRYCIFEDGTGKCYPQSGNSINPNYTVSVFRRVVYLANFRMLKDQLNNTH